MRHGYDVYGELDCTMPGACKECERMSKEPKCDGPKAFFPPMPMDLSKLDSLELRDQVFEVVRQEALEAIRERDALRLRVAELEAAIKDVCNDDLDHEACVDHAELVLLNPGQFGVLPASEPSSAGEGEKR